MLQEDIDKLNNVLGAAFEIGFVFNVILGGRNCLERLGFKPSYQELDGAW